MENWLLIVMLIVLGTILGSFANAMVWRFRKQELLREQIAELCSQSLSKVRDAKLPR